jgi:hypothetical protein
VLPLAAVDAPGAAPTSLVSGLDSFYVHRGPEPSYEEAVAILARDSRAAPAERARAAHALTELLKRLDSDVRTGRAPWHAVPYWGVGAESPAVRLSDAVAHEIGRSASGDEALVPARWLIESDPNPEHQVAGARVLERTPTPAAARLVRELLRAPHPNAGVLAIAIAEAGRRESVDFRSDLTRLSTHHRAAIRDSATAAARKLGVRELPAYVPEKAFTTEIARALTRTLERLHHRVPKEAMWCRYEWARIYGGRTWSDESEGWLLETTPDHYVVFDWFARERTLPRTNTRILPSSLEEAAARVAAVRAAGEDSVRKHLSRMSEATAQFEGDGATLPEALLAAWSFERGDRATAARVLFPALDPMPNDEQLDAHTRFLLGVHYDHLMLETFACRRDYAGTIALARFLSGPQFDGFGPQARARELASQLEHRSGDFVTFVLPDSAEWRHLRNSLTRAEQIAYLVEHLRLLNCFQAGQPGGVWFGRAQHSRALNGEGPWCFGGDESSLVVTNPHEMLGKMGLSERDLAALAPGLLDTSFLPTFGFWRDFHPERHLYRVNELVASFIDEIAVGSLVDEQTIGDMTAPERRACVERVLAWAQENDRPIGERMLRILATSTDYEELWAAQRWASETKSEAAIPLLFDDVERVPKHVRNFVATAYRIDSPAAVPGARAHLNHADVQVRYYSALILLRHGDRDSLEGLETIRRLAELPDGSYVVFHAFDDLLANGRPPAVQLASTILRTPRAQANDPNRLHKVRQLMKLGQSEARDLIQRELADTSFAGERWGTASSGEDLRQRLELGDVTGEDVALWRDGKARFGWDRSLDERRRERQELSAWIGEEFERVERERGKDSSPR